MYDPGRIMVGVEQWAVLTACHVGDFAPDPVRWVLIENLQCLGLSRADKGRVDLKRWCRHEIQTNDSATGSAMELDHRGKGN